MNKQQMSPANIFSHQKLYGLIKTLFKKNVQCVTFFPMLNCAFSPSDTTINCGTNVSSLKE